MKINEILDFDDLVLASLQIMMYGLALALVGPFSLAFTVPYLIGFFVTPSESTGC